MTMPFYVAPEQVMKDRAEYAQKGIARGRSLVATDYDQGVLIVADNPSRSLHKVSEIYDRIAFAGVGKYNEFDQLRVAGVRHADTKGFAFSREDVDARSLANLYAQFLGQVFTHEMKPLEVEIRVDDLANKTTPDQISWSPSWARRPRPTSCTTSRTRERSPTRRASRCWGGRPEPYRSDLQPATRRAGFSTARCGRPSVRSRAPIALSVRRTWKWRCWHGTTVAGRSGVLHRRSSRSCSPEASAPGRHLA